MKFTKAGLGLTTFRNPSKNVIKRLKKLYPETWEIITMYNPKRKSLWGRLFLREIRLLQS